MVRVSTIFDTELQQKVFCVRGDEGYARTTDIIVANTGVKNEFTTGFTLNLSYDVLRDMGESAIVLEVDGEIMDSYDWSYINSTKIIESPILGYEAEHTIVAHYKGNNQCRGSKSQVLIIPSRENPHVYPSNLRYSDDTYSFDKGNVTVAFFLESTKNTDDLSVVIYVDGDYYTTLTVNMMNVYTTLNTLSEGKHTLTAEYISSTNKNNEIISGSSTSVDISVGYKINVIESPSLLIYNGDNVIRARVTDYLGNPIANQQVSLYNGAGSVETVQWSDSDGIVSFYFSEPTSDSYYVGYNGSKSELLSFIRFKPTNVSVKADDKLVSLGMIEPVTVEVTGDNLSYNQSNVKLGDVPIVFSGGLDGTMYTNGNGLVDTSYNGSGAGDVTITATVGGVSGSIVIEDLTQYWKGGMSSWNPKYSTKRATVTNLSNGVKLTANANNQTGWVIFNTDSNYTVDFDVVSVADYRNTRINFWTCTSAFKKGCHVKVVKEGSNCKIYIDNNLVNEGNHSTLYNALQIDVNPSISSNHTVTLNNLKIKKL